MTKAKLFKQLYFIPFRELRECINNVIAENRNIPLEKAKYKKYLRPNEAESVKEFFGVEN